jgi:hypothetical protein
MEKQIQEGIAELAAPAHSHPYLLGRPINFDIELGTLKADYRAST